jgi:hypothetical protein
MGEEIMSRQATDPAVEKVIATITDEELADRYPDRAHFIAAGNPDQGQLATRALFAGDPVVIVYADGREVLMRPEHVGGLAALFLVAAAFLIRLRRGTADDTDVQLPPRTHVEARDSSGHSVAA